MSQVPVVENIILEQFSSLYPGRRPNEAALYVENRAIPHQADPPVYAELLDRFVSPEEAAEQERIRQENFHIQRSILSLKVKSNIPGPKKCRIMEKSRCRKGQALHPRRAGPKETCR
jgi:hypothetical protein